MRVFVLSSLTILFAATAWSQHHVELVMTNGVSKISSVNSDEEEAMSRGHITDQAKWTLNTGLNYQYSFNKCKLRAGLHYSFVQGESTEQFHVYPWIFGSGYDYNYELNMLRKVHYLKVPLLFAYQADKLEIALGVYGAYRFSNSYWATGYLNSDSNVFQGGGNNLANFDAGFQCELRYPLDAKFDLLISGSVGVLDIGNGTEQGATHFVYGLAPTERSLKTRQASIGLSYHLL